MGGGIGVQRDLRRRPLSAHRLAQERLGRGYVPPPTEVEIHRLADFVDRPIQIHDRFIIEEMKTPVTLHQLPGR